MRGLRRVWVIAAVLAWVGAWGQWMAAQEPAPVQQAVPKPLPQEIVDAWKKAGAEVGWMRAIPDIHNQGKRWWPFRSLYLQFRIGGEGEPGEWPAFRFIIWKPGVLASLPPPPAPFGLDLSLTLVRDAGLKELAGLKQLRILDLWGTRVTDAGLKELAGLKQLQVLNLHDTPVTDAGLKELAGLNQLRGLDLALTEVTDAGLKELAGLKQLQVLNLWGTRVTNAGLKELAGLKQLQVLNLSDTRVTDAGLKELAGLKQLRYLNLGGTRVTEAGVAELRKQLPGCHIRRGL
jgi:hypothetical protein